MKEGKSDVSIAKTIENRRNRVVNRENWTGLLVRVVLLIVVGYLLLSQVFLIMQTSGQDMYPALKDGDLLIGFRLNVNKLIRNDVVVYDVNGGRRVGRVIACEGDVIDIGDGGIVTVNGSQQSENVLYPTEGGDILKYPYTVPDGSFFVMDDDRRKVDDSRILGAIPMDRVEAKVITLLRRRGL